MNDKYAKEIAKELKLIRQELQKINKPAIVQIDSEKIFHEMEKRYNMARKES